MRLSHLLVLLALATAGCLESSAGDAPTAAAALGATAESIPSLYWMIEERAGLGWAYAIGAASVETGQSDRGRCPDAVLLVPQGTTRLELWVSAETVQAVMPGAGTFEVEVRSEDGQEYFMGPLLSQSTSDLLEPGDVRTLTVTAPSPGAWTIHMRPIGVVVWHVWDVHLELLGEGPRPAVDTRALSPTCGG